MAVAVGGGLDRFVAKVTLDHRQRNTGLDEPAGVSVPKVMGSGPLCQIFVLGPGQSGHPGVGMEVLCSHGIVGSSAPAPAIISFFIFSLRAGAKVLMRADDNKARIGAIHYVLKLTNQPFLRLTVPQCRTFLLALTQVGSSIHGIALGVGNAMVRQVVEVTLRVGVSRCCKRQPRSKRQSRQHGPWNVFFHSFPSRPWPGAMAPSQRVLLREAPY